MRRSLAVAPLLAALAWSGTAAAQEPVEPADAPAAASATDPSPATSERRFRLDDPTPGRSPWTPREWVLSAGVFDLAKTDRTEAGLELRFVPRRLRLFGRDWRLEPMLGGMVNEDGAYYGYLGLRLPLELGERWQVTPSVGPGIYSAGDSIDLGGPVEFRSGLEISARLGERTSLGISYYHLSNGILYDLNPGEESLVLVLAVRTGGHGRDAAGAAR